MPVVHDCEVSYIQNITNTGYIAGDRIRTYITNLEGWDFTIKIHPLIRHAAIIDKSYFTYEVTI